MVLFLHITVLISAMNPIARIHRSRNQGVETGVVLLTLNPRDPPANWLLPATTALDSSCFKRKKALARRCKNDFLDLGSETAVWPLGATHAFEWTGKVVTVLAGVANPDDQGEIGLLLRNIVKDDMSNTRDLLGHLSVLLCPVIKASGKWHQLRQDWWWCRASRNEGPGHQTRPSTTAP